MDCLTSLVSLDATCAGNGDGIVTLGQIGITEGLLAKVINEEETVAVMVDRTLALAANVVRNDVVTFYADRIIPRSFVDGRGFGIPAEDGAIQTYAGGERGGIVVELGEAGSNQILTLSDVQLLLDFSGPVNITIHDLSTSQVVDTVTIDAVSGIPSGGVRFRLPARRRRTSYFISTDAPSAYKTDLDYDAACMSCNHHGVMIHGVNVWGARLPAATAVRRPNLRAVSHTSGILATVTVECDHAALLCEVRERIALPMLYKVGQLITDRAIHAFDRLNSQTMSKDALRERYDKLGQEYAAAMQNVLSKMPLPNDPTCFICHQRTRTVTAIP
jgi:hypothetical protein